MTRSIAWPNDGKPPLPGAAQNACRCDFEIAQYVRYAIEKSSAHDATLRR